MTHTDSETFVLVNTPATGYFVHYSNGKWGRTSDERHRRTMADANLDAFTR